MIQHWNASAGPAEENTNEYLHATRLDQNQRVIKCSWKTAQRYLKKAENLKKPNLIQHISVSMQLTSISVNIFQAISVCVGRKAYSSCNNWYVLTSLCWAELCGLTAQIPVTTRIKAKSQQSDWRYFAVIGLTWLSMAFVKNVSEQSQ